MADDDDDCVDFFFFFSGHVQLSITVYLEGSRFDIRRSLVWREPVVAAPVYGRLRKSFVFSISVKCRVKCRRILENWKVLFRFCDR